MVTRADRLALRANPYTWANSRTLPALARDVFPSTALGTPHPMFVLSYYFVTLMAVGFPFVAASAMDSFSEKFLYFFGGNFLSFLVIQISYHGFIAIDQYCAQSLYNYQRALKIEEDRKIPRSKRVIKVLKDTTSKIVCASNDVVAKASTCANNVKTQIAEGSVPVITQLTEVKDNVSHFVKENPLTSVAIGITGVTVAKYAFDKFLASSVRYEDNEEYSVDSLYEGNAQRTIVDDIPKSISIAATSVSSTSTRSSRREAKKMQSQSRPPLTYEQLKSFMKTCTEYRNIYGDFRNRRRGCFILLQALCTTRNPDQSCSDEFDYNQFFEGRDIVHDECTIQAFIGGLEKELSGEKKTQLSVFYDKEKDDQFFCPELHVDLLREFLTLRNIRHTIVPVGKRDWRLVAQRNEPRILSNGFTLFALQKSQPLPTLRLEIKPADQALLDMTSIPVNILREFLSEYRIKEIDTMRAQHPRQVFCRYVEKKTGVARYPAFRDSNEWSQDEMVVNFRGIALGTLGVPTYSNMEVRAAAFDKFCDTQLFQCRSL